MAKLARKEKYLVVCFAVALIVLAGVALTLVVGIQQNHLENQLEFIPFSFQLAGNDYLTLAVVQGSGTLCAQDSNSGVQQCTSSSANIQVNVGDQITFTATPAAGYIFDHLEGTQPNAPSGTTTQNPFTMTITFNSGNTSGGVNAYFDVAATVTNSQTSTQTSTSLLTLTETGNTGGVSTVTVTSTGSTVSSGSGIPMPSTWVWMVIGVLALLVIIVLIRR